MIVHRNTSEPWRVTVVDTGLATQTGGRVKRVQEHIGSEPFMLTYGDGVSNIDISELVRFHETHGKMVTMSAYNAGQRFGMLDVDKSGAVRDFREKIQSVDSLVNIGFMVCQPELFDLIEGDDTILERKPLETVARMGELMAYRHTGFWQCMDTLREKEALEKMWQSGQAPWKVWED